MAKIVYENEEIVIDNTELLRDRADVDTLWDEDGNIEKVTQPNKELGSIPHGEEERMIRHDLKRTGWKEPSPPGAKVLHRCPICGTNFPGRPNKIYCSLRCKETGKKRRSRALKREERDFKPQIGTGGEVYFMATEADKETITFVPALNAQTQKDAIKYINSHYPEKKREGYIEQIKEAMKIES